jgi:hypothetical protein
MQRLGVSVIVTDDLASYKQVAEDLGLEQQVCQFHVRRWVKRTLRDLRNQLSEDWHGRQLKGCACWTWLIYTTIKT